MKIVLSFEYGEKKMLFPVDFFFILILATFTIDSILRAFHFHQRTAIGNQKPSAHT